MAAAKKRMSLTQFLREVKGLKKRWSQSSLAIGGDIRTRSSNWESTCPITVLCREKTGIRFINGYYCKAAQKLGLSPRLARSIMSAADNMHRGKRGRRIRRALLKATKLVEPKEK